MARLVTLTTLRSRVQQRANLEVASNAKIYSTAELDDNINEGIAELYGLIAAVPGAPYYLESAGFSTSAGVDTYGIGAGQPIAITDYLSLRGIDVSFGSNIVNTARPFMWKERNRFKYLNPGWTYVQNVYYSLTGKTSAVTNSALDSVKFIPQPPGVFACTLWYIPTPPKLVAPTDAFDGINGFEELVVLSAAIKLLLKQEQFEHAQALAGERARQEQRVEGLLTRDAEEPERVQDVSNLDTQWPGRSWV